MSPFILPTIFLGYMRSIPSIVLYRYVRVCSCSGLVFEGVDVCLFSYFQLHFGPLRLIPRISLYQCVKVVAQLRL